jgi:hypothetical protein
MDTDIGPIFLKGIPSIIRLFPYEPENKIERERGTGFVKKIYRSKC